MSPICTTCNDTHMMKHGDREVLCTGCPIPCRECGKGRAYCNMTPCECICHDKHFQYRESRKKAEWISCKCGANKRTVSGMWPAPLPDEIFIHGSGGYRADRFEETHSINRCFRYETVVKELP